MLKKNLAYVFTNKETEKMAFSLAVFILNTQIEIWTAVSS